MDIIEDAAFEVMFGFSDNGRLECDHSKFDAYSSQQDTGKAKRPGFASSPVAGRNSRASGRSSRGSRA